MGEELQQVALDIPDIVEKVEEIEEKIEEAADKAAAPPVDKTSAKAVDEAEAPEEAPPRAKAKGRPKGSKNKEPSKPRKSRAAPAPKVVEEPVEQEESPLPTPSGRAIPNDGSDLATQMFRLLQQQQYTRQQRKRALYESWFH